MRSLNGGRHVKNNPFEPVIALTTSLILAIAALVALDVPAHAAIQTFSYTGGPQLYVVPDGVSSITVTVSGAEGGQQSGGAVGGKGAAVSATIAVTPGEVYMVVVGGNGTTNRGYNGGGRGAGNGGGASDIRRQSGAFNTSSSCAFTLTCAVSDRIIVAGGGGGGGWMNGGSTTAIGGDAGQTGLPGVAYNLAGGDATEGLGATPIAGGAAGTSTFTSSGSAAGAGALANGGASGWVANATGGGGGGGYYGGGAGAVSTNAVPAPDGTSGGGGGSSWAGGARLLEAAEISKANGLIEYSALQNHYNLLVRDDYENDSLQALTVLGIEGIPYFGLARGFLSGKYRPGVTVESVRAGGVTDYTNDRGWATLEKLDQVAANHGVPVAAVALAWVRQQPTVAAPIASARTVEQLREFMVGINLSADELTFLTT